MFDTKIAIVLLSSLKTWQKLNVTSFLTSGVIGQTSSLIGERYIDKSNYEYLPLNRQPVVVLEADLSVLKKSITEFWKISNLFYLYRGYVFYRA